MSQKGSSFENMPKDGYKKPAVGFYTKAFTEPNGKVVEIVHPITTPNSQSKPEQPQPKAEPSQTKLDAPVLVQPEIIKVASIPEVKTEPPVSGFKKWDKGVNAWEVSEQDYVDRQFEKEKARLSANIKYRQGEIDKLNPSQKAKKADYESDIHLWKTRLERIEKKDENTTPVLEHNYKSNYFQIVKEAIKHGEAVPTAVINQKPEFEVAKNSRARYEKGLHTSFANKSQAVNAVNFLEKGYKVKRQDGKEIQAAQIGEIDSGMTEIQESVGNVKDIMQKSDLTIAHTSGTFPFLNGSAGGLYHPTENSITTGVTLFGVYEMRSLGHEWGHWLDYASGTENQKGYEFYSNGDSTRKIKSQKTALSNSERYSNPLFHKAEDSMNNAYEVRKLQHPSLNHREQTPEEKQKAKEVTARVGSYYRDPREIWARLTEQYIAEEHGKATIAAESPEYYESHPAYWSKSTFNEMKPMVKAEMERRIEIARGQ